MATLSRSAVLGRSAAAAALLAWRPGVATAENRSSARIEALIGRMTLDEKIGQLTLYPDDVRPTPRPINPDINAQAEAAERTRFQYEEIRAGRVGALLGGTGVNLGRKLQEAALASRLGIPLLFGADVLHGLRTIFPIPLGLAASFEPRLAEQTARAAAVEMTAVGVHWTYAPMVDIARDQRWGRVAEGSGEDPYLGSRFSEAYVRGFQGTDLTSPRSAAACPKHFAGYGAVIGGMEYNTTDLTERELRQVHLPPFQAAFDAGAMTTMAAFSDLDGVPASGNRRLMTDILCGEMGFEGFVVSDAASAEELVPHGLAADERQAAELAFNAGVDVNMGGGLFRRHLRPLVEAGAVSQTRLNEAVRRVLRVKEAVGLFDDPYRSLDPRRESTELRSAQALALAREAAVKSIVLLQNKADVLPLAKGVRVALIGPLGDDPNNLDGCWAPWAKSGEGKTLATGLRAAIGAERLIVERGSNIEAPIEGGVERAVAAAQAADVVVLAVGESQKMSGEASARAEIVVPEPQQILAEAIKATGKPVVVVLSTGRALALKGAIRDADAILVTWFLGSESGVAITDILLGVQSPSGRLPVSFPQSVGQQPFYYNHRATGRPQAPGEGDFFKARYREVSHAALFPFGFGLGYATVRYGSAQLDHDRLPWTGEIVLSATLTNTGSRPAEEVAQLYIRDLAASITQPVRALKGFAKVRLAPGASQEVRFRISRRDLEFVGQDLKWRAEPGAFQAWIAPSSSAGEPVAFVLDPS